METKTTILSISLALLLSSSYAKAEQISTNMAKMQAMDKITGKVSIIEVPVGGEVTFGSFSVVVRDCRTNAEGEVPENYAFVDVTDKSFDKEEFNIFKGWMLSSSPAVNAIEHPIYDVWLLKCVNSDISAYTLLSEEDLAKRDTLPQLKEIQDSKNSQEENLTNKEEATIITFKDSMYKQEKPTPKNIEQKNENDEGKPHNLLKITEDFEEPEEDMISVSADELSKAMQDEAQKLNEQEANIIDDELSAAIDAELKQHKN